MLIKRHLSGPIMAPISTAGDGGGGGAPALTMEAVLAEVDKRVGNQLNAGFERFRKDGLGAAIDEKLAPINTSLGTISEALGKLTAAPGGGAGGSGGSATPPEINVKVKQLEEATKAQGTMIENLKRERDDAAKRAETSERHSIIRAALGNMHYISDIASQTAFTIVEPHIKRMDDGSLVGGINGDNFPVNDFVKDYLTKEHPYLLRASGASGSGAPSSPGVRMGVKADLADIKVGMKPETRDSVVASIGAALQSVG